jgi:hypothetical protein
MDGTGNWDTIKDSDLALTDITTNDVSTSKHGFVPKAPNTAAQFLNGEGAWSIPSSSGSGGSIRQTVLSGSVDANNLPDYTTAVAGLDINIAATTDNVIISFAAGFDTTGPVDHIGYIDTDTSISSLTDDSTNYLYFDRNITTGAITSSFVVVAPTYAFTAPAHGSNVHWFSLASYKMYLSNGSDTWTEKQRVFFGEAVTSSGSVASIVNYAFSGRYRSAWTDTIPANGVATSFSHNIGTTLIENIIELCCISNDAGWIVGDTLDRFQEANGTEFMAGPQMFKRRNTVIWQRASGGMPAISDNSGNRGTLTNTRWKYRAIARRAF